ncbi:DUF4373 domain-containing protein [Enterococcus diestrammenae]|uniref:DUF4373 domain-containing protein n=1 Tax=Enterococcus diestrammenae TaxID=1155073 RepID=UPI0019562222
MVRPIKQGLDYFPTDVAFLTESKVWLIKQKCGLGTMDTLMTLLSRIYGEEGYFMPWNTEVLDLVAYHGQVPHEQVLNVVEKALAVGFFDLESFRRHRILTAVDIQKKFITATRRRKTVFLNKNYLLISESERENLVIGEDVVAVASEAAEMAENAVAEDFSQMVQQTADAIKDYEAAIGELVQAEVEASEGGLAEGDGIAVVGELGGGNETVVSDALMSESGAAVVDVLGGESETAIGGGVLGVGNETEVSDDLMAESETVVGANLGLGNETAVSDTLMAESQTALVAELETGKSQVKNENSSASEPVAESETTVANKDLLAEAEGVVASASEKKTETKGKRKSEMARETGRKAVVLAKAEGRQDSETTKGANDINIQPTVGLTDESKGRRQSQTQSINSDIGETNRGVDRRVSVDAAKITREPVEAEPLVLQKTASFRLWQQLWAGPNVATQAELTRLLRSYGDPLLAAVLKIASAQQITSACSLPFVKGYLKRWQQAGVTDVAAARAYERQCLQKNEEKRQQLAQAQQQAAEVVKKRRDSGKKNATAIKEKRGNGSASRRTSAGGKAAANYGRDGRPYRRQPVEDWSAYPDGRVDRQYWLKMLKKMQQLTPVVPQPSDYYQLTEAELAWIHDETQGEEAAVYRQAAGVWE